MSNIFTNVIKNLKQVGRETVEISVDNTGKIASGIITGAELVGIKPKSEQDLNKIRAEEANKKQQEEKIKQEYMGQPGRNVETEIKQVTEEKKRQEAEEERFLENIKRQREAEARERNSMIVEPGNAKREAAKHQGQRGHKKQAPDPAAMSATNEMTGGKID